MSLIAWWKLDGNLLDSSGNGRHLTQVGTFTDEDGIVCKSKRKNGSGHVLLTPSLPQCCNWTISFWLKRNNNSGTYQHPNGGQFEGLWIGTNNILMWHISDITWPNITSNKGVLNLGEWYHISIVYDNMKGYNTFINGTPDKNSFNVEGTKYKRAMEDATGD